MSYQFQGKNSAGKMIYWQSDIPDFFGNQAPEPVTDIVQTMVDPAAGQAPPPPPPPPQETSVSFDEFIATPGQTEFILTLDPIDENAVFFFIDGYYSNQFSILGNTCTYTGPSLVGGENILVKYFQNIEMSAQVNSVYGRYGDIVAESGDYSASLVTNDSSVTGANVQEALNTLSNVLNLSTYEINTSLSLTPNGTGGLQWSSIMAPVSTVFGRTGDVVSVSGDYTSDQITNSSSKNGSTVTEALDNLTFIGLADVPFSYGFPGQVVKVNPTQDGLIFQNQANGPSLSLQANINNELYGSDAFKIFEDGDQSYIDIKHPFSLTPLSGVRIFDNNDNLKSAIISDGYQMLIGTDGYVVLNGSMAIPLGISSYYVMPDAPGSVGQVLKQGAAGKVEWGTDSATAGGPNRSIQFSTNGVIDGNSTLLWIANTTDRIVDIASSSSALTQVGLRVKSSTAATVLELLYNENAGSVKLNAPAHSLDLSGQTKVKIQGISRFGASATDPVGGVSGDEYWNTALKERMYYNGTRWVSGATLNVASGRSGNTSAGQYYRGVDTLLLDAANKGFPVRKGSCVYLGLTRADSGATTLEVLVNGVVVGTLAHSAAGLTSSTTVFDFPAGLMSFRNISTGVQTTDVQIQLHYKLRA